MNTSKTEEQGKKTVYSDLTTLEFKKNMEIVVSSAFKPLFCSVCILHSILPTLHHKVANNKEQTFF